MENLFTKCQIDINTKWSFKKAKCNFSYLTILLNVEILRPYSHLIGVLAGANAHINIDEDKNND